MAEKKHKRNIYISKISLLHQTKMIFRIIGLLSVAGVLLYQHLAHVELSYLDNPAVVIVVGVCWVVYLIEMAMRFFPNDTESMGCQKQFKRNYDPQDYDPEEVKKQRKHEDLTAIVVGILWLALVAGLGVLYYFQIIDEAGLIVFSLLFSVCDMICILYFCPFQQWIMKNRCCVRCRIYNWDYAMMFLPLIYIRHFITWSLVAFALALLIKWEIEYRMYPERFAVQANKSLECENCAEKLCSHKVALQKFIAKQNALIRAEVSKELGKIKK